MEGKEKKVNMVDFLYKNEYRILKFVEITLRTKVKGEK
jgi:hypothetical protein